MKRDDVFGNTYFINSNKEVIDFLRNKIETADDKEAEIYEEIIERIERYVPDKEYPHFEVSESSLEFCCQYFKELLLKYFKKRGKGKGFDKEFSVLNETLNHYIQQYEYVKRRDSEVVL